MQCPFPHERFTNVYAPATHACPETASFAEAGIDAHLAERRCQDRAMRGGPSRRKGGRHSSKGYSYSTKWTQAFAGMRSGKPLVAGLRAAPNPVVAASSSGSG